MIKQLWAQIVSAIGGLKTPERRLLFGVLLLIIITLWLLFKDNYSDLKSRIHSLEDEVQRNQVSKETQRILYQDKIDQCAAERYNELKKLLEQAEILKDKIKKIK